MDLLPCSQLASLSDEDSDSSLTDADHDDAGIDVSALFAAVPLPQSDLQDFTSLKMSPEREADNDAPKDLSQATLLRDALERSGIRRRHPKRTRCSGKVSFDARVLQQIETDPSLVRRTKPLSRLEHKTGYHEFR